MGKAGFTVLRCLLGLFFFLSVCAGLEASVIPVSKYRSTEMPGGAPAGWFVEKKVGVPSMKMEKDGENYYLHLQSFGNSSFGVRTSSRVNVKEFPIITWRWRVDKMPAGGDVRKKAADDQALQVYIAFKETGFPAVLNTPVIGYIWDNEAPKGWSGRSSQIAGDKLRYIVLRNKTDKPGQWYTERRNIYEDYKKLFSDINGGEPLGVTTGVQVYINTQRTKKPAEGMMGQIYFSNETSDVVVTEAAKEKITARTAAIIAKPVVMAAPKRKPVFVMAAEKDFSKPGCVNISVEFETNATEINSDIDDKVKLITEYLVRYPQAKFTLTGHTDHVGSDAYNMALSIRRAESVKNYLIERFSIEAKRLIVKGAGSSQPVADNSTKEGQKQNRRVAIQDCPE
jgi:outer membrane protein OmpA-like peptidoglycan-associated protein